MDLEAETELLPALFLAAAQDGVGGVSAVSAHVSAATMERVTMHLQETTGDSSVAELWVQTICHLQSRPSPPVNRVRKPPAGAGGEISCSRWCWNYRASGRMRSDVCLSSCACFGLRIHGAAG